MKQKKKSQTLTCSYNNKKNVEQQKNARHWILMKQKKKARHLQQTKNKRQTQKQIFVRHYGFQKNFVRYVPKISKYWFRDRNTAHRFSPFFRDTQRHIIVYLQ